MTNQSSGLREPEREEDHLRPHLNPKSDILEATPTATNAKRLKSERCSPSPTRHQPQLHLRQREHLQLRERERDRDREKNRDRERERERECELEQQLHQQSREVQSTLSTLHQSHQSLPSPPTPSGLYPRKINRDYNPEPIMNDEHHQLLLPHSASASMHNVQARTPEDEDDDDDEDDSMHNDIGTIYI